MVLLTSEQSTISLFTVQHNYKVLFMSTILQHNNVCRGNGCLRKLSDPLPWSNLENDMMMRALLFVSTSSFPLACITICGRCLMHLNMSSLGTLSKSNQCRSTVFPTLNISPSLLRKSIFVSSPINFHHMILRLPFSFLLAVIFTITDQT